MYAFPHSGRQLFSLRLAGLTILTGLMPTSDSNVILRMKARWLPTPNPKGITHMLLISRSLDTQRMSIGCRPQKKVAPGLALVWDKIASCRLSPSLSASAFPSLPSITCSLWCMKSTILLHCLRCFKRCLYFSAYGLVSNHTNTKK